MDKRDMNPPPYTTSPPYPYPSAPIDTQPKEVLVINQNFGPESCHVTCPSCRATVNTRVIKEAVAKTHLIALLLCVVCFPCACVPYCTDSCLGSKHYCPNCHAYLGSYGE